MKKTLVMIAVLLILVSACALSEQVVDQSSAAVTAEPLTWDYLTTVGGCAAFVLIVVQLTKGLLDKLVKVPTSLYAYVLAVATMILAMVFTTGFSWNGLVMTFFNGWIVASTASHTYDTVAPKE